MSRQDAASATAERRAACDVAVESSLPLVHLPLELAAPCCVQGRLRLPLPGAGRRRQVCLRPQRGKRSRIDAPLFRRAGVRPWRQDVCGDEQSNAASWKEVRVERAAPLSPAWRAPDEGGCSHAAMRDAAARRRPPRAQRGGVAAPPHAARLPLWRRFGDAPQRCTKATAARARQARQKGQMSTALEHAGRRRAGAA